MFNNFKCMFKAKLFLANTARSVLYQNLAIIFHNNLKTMRLNQVILEGSPQNYFEELFYNKFFENSLNLS